MTLQITAHNRRARIKIAQQAAISRRTRVVIVLSAHIAVAGSLTDRASDIDLGTQQKKRHITEKRRNGDPYGIASVKCQVNLMPLCQTLRPSMIFRPRHLSLSSRILSLNLVHLRHQ